MATAKERVERRITERIPHKDVAYAYLELEASNVNEFASLRSEALENPALSHYAFAAEAPAAPKSEKKTPSLTAAQKAKLTAKKDVEKGEPAAGTVAPSTVAPQEAEPAEAARGVADLPAAAPDSTPTEGLSPREIARQRLLAKKGA